MTKEEQAKIFSTNLQRYIKALGYTQIEIAEALGVSQQAVHTWVTGENVPRLNKAQRLAAFLNVKLTDLVYPHGMEETLEEALARRPELQELLTLAIECSTDEINQLIKIAVAIHK